MADIEPWTRAPQASPRRWSGGALPTLPISLIVVRVSIYVAAAALQLFVIDAEHAPVAALICVGAALCQPALIPLARRIHYQIAQAVFDTVAVIAIALVVPHLWYTSVILLVAGTTLLVATVRPELHLLMLAALVVGLLVLGSAAGEIGWAPNLLIAGAVLAVAVRGTRLSRRHQERTEAHLEQAMLAARAIVMTTGVQSGSVIEMYGDVEDVTGWPADQLMAKRPSELVHPEDLADYRAAIERLAHVPELDFVGRMYDASGEIRWMRYTGRVESTAPGEIVVRGMLADVTAIHKITDELYEQARRDRITDLPNRQRLEEDLDTRAVHAQPFALLIADIRQFKAINDTLGHHIGDLVLSMMGARLAQSGHTDGAPTRTVYRLSADQFAIVIDDADLERAEAIAHAISQDCRRPYYVGRVALGAPVSVGLAMSAQNVAPSVTLRQADVALYAAKSANSPVEVYHADMQRFTLENLMLSAAVEHGLDHDEFVLHFQPQVDLRTGRIVGCEGLVRWVHPERGLLPPDEFLETVRVSALFDRFTLAMVRQTLRAAASAQGTAHSLRFAVNIEMASLINPGFTDKLLAELSAHHIGHHRVVLEMTETDFADHLVAAASIDPSAELQRLRAGGFEVAIDDFGTGSSSLARLDKLPADEVKLDGSFIQAIGTSERAELLLSSIIGLGNALGLRVVAEGIEELVQLSFLTEAGCRTGQGWLFNKAMPLAELLATLHVTYPVGRSDAPAVVTPLRSRRTG